MTRQTGILLITFFLVMINGSAIAQHDTYFFRTLEGRAVLSRTGGSTWLALSQVQPVEIKPGDMVNVEGNGRGELLFPDGTVARLKNNAMVTLQRYGLNLRLGYVWLTVRRSSDIFKVVTPLGSCSVLGTSFDVDVDRFGKTQVRVFSGIVAVRAEADTRNRQLVLQPGMRTVVVDKSKVADKPDKFSHSTIEPALISEWSSRTFAPAATTLPAAITTPARSAPFRPQRPQLQQIEPPPSGPNQPLPRVSVESALPPIRPEIEGGQIDLPPVYEIVDGIKPGEGGKTRIIARQRSEFLEMLRRQQLERESVIGGRFEEEGEMRHDQHGSELGQYHRPVSTVTDNESLDREYYTLRNRILRVQSQIRQTELAISTLINQGVGTTAQRRKISSLQAEHVDLQSEQRVLSNRLRDLQAKKR
ncbi:MAG: FecR family protein [Candidatus Riflebacteria bacterium]|nr:FecR family protein [Candidatus Riflebacteria bacterium]